MSEKYTDEDLKKIGIEEANAKLEGNDFKRWQELRKDSLIEEAEENAEEWAERDEEAIDTLISSGRNKLRKEIEILGEKHEFLFLLNRKQRQLFQEIKKKREETDKENLENVEGIVDSICEFLGSVSKDFDKGEWKKIDGEIGFAALYDVFISVMSEFQEEFESKKELVEKFRGEKG